MISRRSFFGALAVAPLAAVRAEAEAEKGVTLSVGVSIDDEGKMQAYVRDLARRSAQEGIAAYDRQLRQSLPSRLADLELRHL